MNVTGIILLFYVFIALPVADPALAWTRGVWEAFSAPT